jgi:lipid-binding SYLF domain-containing protein
MRSLIIIASALVLTISAPVGAIDDKIADRLWESSKVLDELVNAPDADIPKDLLKKAECVAVIPGLKKAAFGFGGQLGRGAVSCRKDQGKGPFGPPVMISIKGGSFGFQIGGQEIDVVMLFMTPDSMKHLMRDKVTLGVDASAAGGPKGRAASAETNATMRAEILSYARSRGLFAGISLKGAVLSPDKDANQNLYNQEIEAKDLLENGNVTVPEPGRKFVETVSRTSSGN